MGVTVLALIALMVLTVAWHEAGHLIAARYYGWRFQGFGARWWGVGVKVVPGDLADLWKIALAGPAASALLTVALWILAPLDPVLGFGMTLNALLVVANMLPLPMADGGHILRGIRA